MDLVKINYTNPSPPRRKVLKVERVFEFCERNLELQRGAESQIFKCTDGLAFQKEE